MITPDRAIHPELLIPGRKPTVPVELEQENPLTNQLAACFLWHSLACPTELVGKIPVGSVTYNGSNLVVGENAVIWDRTDDNQI